MNWISVKDRLPETNDGFSKNVLVWTTEHGALIGNYTDDSKYLEEGVGGEWTVGSPDDVPIMYATVTHWCEVTPPHNVNGE